MEQLIQRSRIETENMVKEIEYLEVSKRKLLGHGLGSCSLEELQEIDSQLEQSLENIRARKVQLYKEQIQQLKAKEKMLLEENAKLYEKPSTSGSTSLQIESPKMKTAHVETKKPKTNPPINGKTQLQLGTSNISKILKSN
ncbi:hypothetical protein SLE2022_371880 [Rubroshorea leprosula]